MRSSGGRGQLLRGRQGAAPRTAPHPAIPPSLSPVAVSGGTETEQEAQEAQEEQEGAPVFPTESPEDGPDSGGARHAAGWLLSVLAGLVVVLSLM